MGHVFKISLPGYDVSDATPEQCSIHSDFNSPKIDTAKDHFLNVNVTFDSEPPNPASGSSTETVLFEFTHGYLYTPQVWLHSDFSQNYGSGALVRDVSVFGRAIIVSPTVVSFALLNYRVDNEKVTLFLFKSYLDVLGGDPLPNVAGIRISTRFYIFAEEAL